MEKFTMSDRWALFKMSLRNWFWSIDGVDGFKHMGLWFKFFCVLFLLMSIEGVILMPIRIISSLVRFATLGDIFKYVIREIFTIILCFGIAFNPERLKMSFNYKKSAYYKNTKKRPSEIIRDKGLYGEYIATMSAEKCLQTNNVRGYVFNNVLVPQHGGSFTEIDILTVSEMGIHVIEAKSRIGTFTGNYGDIKWKQQLGSNVYEITNPLFQNLWHCNYLSEYLHGMLPNCSLKQKNIFNVIRNCVLFVSNNIVDNTSDYIRPNIDMFIGMAETGYAVNKFKKGVLTSDEVKMLAELIKPIASYSPIEYQRKMQQRQINIDNGMYNYDEVYHVMKCEYNLKNGEHVYDTVVCNEYNGYYFILDMNDNWFKSIPTIENIQILQSFRTLNEALQYFKQFM